MLAKNMLFNLVGLAAPILLALVCIPPLIAGMGTAAFGLLTLVWVVLGYFSIFDLGVGRALTLAVAAKRAQGPQAEVRPLIRTGLMLTGGLGCAGAALLAALASPLAGLMTGDDAALSHQAEVALYAVAAALPFVTTTAALRGVLEAYDRFDITSAIRLAMGFVTYGGPLVVLQFQAGLVPVVAFLAVARVVTWAVHMVAVWQVIPQATKVGDALGRSEIRALLVSGGWMTVSNVISPLLSYLDRFVVASLVGAAPLAYYTTPYEAISRLTVIPDAILGVLFPAWGAAMATDPSRARQLFGQSFRVMIAVMLPLACLIVVSAEPLLTAWISADFAAQSYTVLQILTVGIAVNSVARVTFTVIQSAGRADVTAKLHLCEFPLFLVLLVWLTSKYGIVGSAMAWSIRASVDFLLLLVIQSRVFPVQYELTSLTIVLGLVACAAALSSGMSGLGWPFAVGTIAAAVCVSAFRVLTAADRSLICRTARRIALKR